MSWIGQPQRNEKMVKCEGTYTVDTCTTQPKTKKASLMGTQCILLKAFYACKQALLMGVGQLSMVFKNNMNYSYVSLTGD